MNSTTPFTGGASVGSPYNLSTAVAAAHLPYNPTIPPKISRVAAGALKREETPSPFPEQVENVAQLFVNALERWDKNLDNSGALGQLERLLTDYASFLQPHKNEKLRAKQSQSFRPVCEKLDRMFHKELKRALQKFLGGVCPQNADLKRALLQMQFPSLMNIADFLNPLTGCVIRGGVTNPITDIDLGRFNDDPYADLLAGNPYTGVGPFRSGGATRVNGKPVCLQPINATAPDGVSSFFMLGPGGNFGWVVRFIQNLRNNGLDTFVITAPFLSPGGISGAGAAFLGDGTNISQPPQVNISDAVNGTSVTEVDGRIPASYLGGGGIASGDLDGRGKPEIIILAPTLTPDQGYALVLSGENRSWSDPGFNGVCDGSQCFLIFLPLGDFSQLSNVETADLDNDGRKEVLFGIARLGLLITMKGQPSFPPTVNATSRTGATFSHIYGPPSFGHFVRYAGNRTGKPLILVGAPLANNSSGAYFVLNPEAILESGMNVSTDLNGTNGAARYGDTPGEELGYAGEGDLDLRSNGFGDVAVAAPKANNTFGRVEVTDVSAGASQGILPPPYLNILGKNVSGLRGLGTAVSKGNFNGRPTLCMLSPTTNEIFCLNALNPPANPSSTLSSNSPSATPATSPSANSPPTSFSPTASSSTSGAEKKKHSLFVTAMIAAKTLFSGWT